MELTYHEAIEYIWRNSPDIRDWYTTEHNFDLDDYSRSEYRTFGKNAPGNIIASILYDGIVDGLIVQIDDNRFSVWE
jgi:hypothetical protein